ncbi:MAG TPA: hypothetical protein VIV11_11165, partial [Kofleriaceae bacterium]
RWIEMQRLSANGQPAGVPVVLSSGPWNGPPDADGGRVVWTTFATPGATEGSVVLHDLATGEQTFFDAGFPVGNVRVHGDRVAWTHQGEQPAVRYYDMAWGPLAPSTLCDQKACVHPFSSLDLGSRYLVWEQTHVLAAGAKVVVGYDMLMGRQVAFLDGAGNHTAREPSSFGDHTAYTYRDLMTPDVVRVEVAFGTRSDNLFDKVFIGPANSIMPSLGGELLAYGRYDQSYFNVEIVELGVGPLGPLGPLATGNTVVVGDPQTHEITPDVLGRDVVYLSNRMSNSAKYDVFLARVSPP